MFCKKAITMLLVSLLAAGSLSAQTETRLTVPGLPHEDYIAYNVALRGDYVFLSTPPPYRVFVLERTDSTWTQVQMLVNDNGDEFDGFGLSTSVDGDYLVVGAGFRRDDGHTVGSAHVFKRNGTTWQHQQELSHPDPENLFFMGQSVSISSDYAIVGAHLDKGLGGPFQDGPGAAFIFKRVGERWQFVQKLRASDATPFNPADRNNFGGDVAIHGDRAIIGATSSRNDAGHKTGAAYIFERSGEVWQQKQKLHSPDSDQFLFGEAVAIQSNYAIVGVRSANGTGEAYIFERSAEAWHLVQRLTPSWSGPSRFGISVAISDRYAVVGAPDDREAAFNGGAIYVYERVGSTWHLTHKLMSKYAVLESNLGVSVVLDGDKVLAGAPGPPSLFDLSSTPTALENDTLAEGFGLTQNYPNPFKTATQITYTVAAPQHVRVSLHDLLGREVATLVDAIKPAGTHTVVFEAGNLPSGVYLYCMDIDEAHAETRKMLLLK